MKYLPMFVWLLVNSFVLQAQPDLTLWITPDGYHNDHNHSAEQQYFCDSSYYIFYHQGADSLFVTLKNEGIDALTIYSLRTTAIDGAVFSIEVDIPIVLQPNEMYSVKLAYTLPDIYANGINGSLAIESNDPSKPICQLFFDVGCLAHWEVHSYSDLGISGGCHEPIVFMEDFNQVMNPNMVYRDSMNFYSYEPALDSSHKMMHLWYKGIKLHRMVEVIDEFSAGKLVTPHHFNLIVDSSEVKIRKSLNVEGRVDIGGDLEVYGTMEVRALTTPSDRRLKKSIQSLNGAIPTILNLTPTTYTLKGSLDGDGRQYGFIAQDLEKVLPSLVHQDKEGVLSVNYLQIIPWLTAAIQEQQQTIQGLYDRLNKLESR
ncbi:MAG: hypothetical protein HKN87_05400 [Saprospiraceae bacterium]|nr:hypothetical protein [Saprospiraceae bacterium]